MGERAAEVIKPPGGFIQKIDAAEGEYTQHFPEIDQADHLVTGRRMRIIGAVAENGEINV